MVYLDANPFIYLVEGSGEIAEAARTLFAMLEKRPGSGVTSELTLAEVLPKAVLPERRRSYLDLIVWSRKIELLPVSREVLIETASYRRAAMTRDDRGREVMPKLPDAVHVVTAVRCACRFIVSNDGRLRVPAGMRVVGLDRAGLDAIGKGLP